MVAPSITRAVPVISSAWTGKARRTSVTAILSMAPSYTRYEKGWYAVRVRYGGEGQEDVVSSSEAEGEA